MTIFAAVELRWYPDGQSGPNECDLMRAMVELVNLYKADTSPSGNFDETTETTSAEISRAVDWLHAKYGSGPRREK